MDVDGATTCTNQGATSRNRAVDHAVANSHNELKTFERFGSVVAESTVDNVGARCARRTHGTGKRSGTDASMQL